MKKLYTLLTAILLSSQLAGCVTVIDAVSEDPITPDPTKRSFGAYWDDKQLQTIIRVNLKKADPKLSKLNINIYSYNSVVLITGEAPTHALRDLAGETARKIDRVRQVYNEIQIKEKRSFIDKTKDTWLSSKLKTKLIGYKDIDSSRVEIIVEDKVVFLMGLLSRAQTEKITNVVRKTRGVKKVIRAVEYID